MSRGPIAVTIFTGFLGSGKSTLLQHWLEQMPRGDVAVVVNERGEVGIDGELLAAHVARLREIAGGCVCCTSQAELMSALVELSESEPAPKRIVVETSGAASPAGVIRGITAPRTRARLTLDGVVTVVDVTRARATLGYDIAIEQLGFADVVVLSHVDQVADSQTFVDVDGLRAAIERHAPAAVVAESRCGVVEKSFLDLLAERSQALRMLPRGSGHATIDAVSLALDGELDEERFTDWVERALGSVEARILRVKGILAVQGVEARVILQGVSEAVDVQLGRPWEGAERNSRLVVLGLGLDAAQLEAGFRSCSVQRPASESG